jgi:hypothetical protein
VALSWSPPGIGKYRRSALAVLTSSYVLSLWDPGRNPAEPSSWKRAVVINSHVEKYFAGLAVSEETLRRRKRIRSMSWAAALPDNFKRNHEYETFLAINNNFNEVLILGVSRLVPSKGPAAGAKVLSTSSYIPDREAQRQPGQEIKWAPWTLDAARAESILSCNFGGLGLSLRFIMLEAQVHYCGCILCRLIKLTYDRIKIPKDTQVLYKNRLSRHYRWKPILTTNRHLG